MDMSKLKPLNSHIQIMSVIENASLFGGDIWQSDSDKEGKHLSRIIQIANDFRFDRIILRTPNVVKINPELPIYVRLNYRNIIFKLQPSEFKVNGDKITCNYPYEAHALEERKGGDRYVLPYKADLSLSLKRTEKNMRELIYEMELRIIDVSEKGFGVLISGYNRDYFKKNDRFWLRAVDHKELRTPIMGTVCYVAPKGYYLKRGDV